jgi:hypothetical protein
MGSGGELPFTGIGTGILTGAAVIVTIGTAMLAAASAPIAAFLGGVAAIATRFVNRSTDSDDVT